MNLRTATLILTFTSVIVAQETVNGPEGDCGFSKFRTQMISDFVRGSTISQKEPDYPLAAKAAGLAGEVRVRILINKQGLVEGTCPVFVKGSPRPSRVLVTAAEAAALRRVARFVSADFPFLDQMPR